MKKILALTLVLMLTLTSVFTGVAVSAEDAAVEETPTVITETVWEEEYGIKVDESIFPGYYLGNAYQIWDDPDQSKWTTEDGIRYYMVDSKGNAYTFRDPILHRKYAPSVAIDAGRTGGKGDNALVFGLPMTYTNGYLMFNNRNSTGGIVCGSGTWEISFDVRLVAGKVNNIYANFRDWAPGITTNANCVTANSTAVNVSGNTDGYSGDDISTGRWTNLKYTATVQGQTNCFYINFTAPDEGAIVLIDNIKIENSSGVNYLVGDKFSPITPSQNAESPASPYYDEFAAGTLYINNEFGNFNTVEFVDSTGWSEYGLAVDQTIVPGYYLANDPYCFSEDATETSKPGNDGAPYLYSGGSWYGDSATRRKWAPAVAIGAGKTGRYDDNALVFGMPKATAQTALAFYVRNQSNIVFKKDTHYQISFDIKSVAGSCKGIYSTLVLNKPAPASPTKYTCENTLEGVVQYTYNQKYNEETGTYGTDGYSQTDIDTEKWTTLTFNVTPVSDCNWFYINIVPEDANGAVVLVDNIVIQNANGDNLFVDDNVCFTASASTYKDKYSAVQHYLGTFDYAKSETVDNVVDSNVTYVPVNVIGNNSGANVAPTLSEAGEGVNGSYAINMGVNKNYLNNVAFKAYNPVAKDTIHQNDLYMFEFKARLKEGQAAKLDVGIATNEFNPADGFYHNMQIFQNGTVVDSEGNITAYKHKSYTQYYLQVMGDEITSEWKTFKFYATTNCYANCYRHLKFTLTGKDATTVIQLDDIKGYTVANGDLTPIYVWSAGDPNGSSFDLAQVSAYDVTVSETDGYIVTVPTAGVTAAEFIENMNLNADLEYGYRNNKEIYSNDTLIAADATIATDYALKIVGNGKGGQYNGVYETFTIAVKNDISGDGAVDARDIVRAKKISAGSLTATDAQLVAANATDGNGIQAEEVLALRGIFMN